MMAEKTAPPQDDLRDLLQLASPDGQRAVSRLLLTPLSPEFLRRAARRLDTEGEATTTLPSTKEAS